MRNLYHERGYTLFLTVLTTFIFSIIAISLITISISGAKRSVVREEVIQATELSEKGLNQITQQINYDIQKELDKHEDGLTRSAYIQEINKVVDKYMCGNTEIIEGDTGDFDACVLEQLDKGLDVLPQRIKFESTGYVEDKEKELITTVEIGGNLSPDNMQYAVNTFITKECAESRGNCQAGEGNLYLHGGSSIQGDINVDRNLITSNRSHEKYAAHHWIHSYFPSVKEKPDGSASKVLVGENVYTFQWDNVSGTKISGFDYAKHISEIDIPNKSPYTKKDVIDENVFVGDYVPEISNRTDHPIQSGFDIEAEKEKYFYTHNDPGVTHLQTAIINGTTGVRRVIRNQQSANEKIFPKIDNKFEADFIINGNSSFKQFSTYQNLDLGKIRNDNIIEFKEGAYVGGDLRIRKNTEVKGPIYVNGDVIIEGKNVTINSVLYVNGEVFIRHTASDATLGPQVKGDFIIYANGKIVMHRMNRFNDHPTEMNSFLYSNESIEIDGNESNVKLKGGISAPRIVLNSIRGRSKAAIFGDGQLVEARGFEGWAEQARRESRLQIIYDKNVLDKYSHLILENRITRVPPAKITDIEESFN